MRERRYQLYFWEIKTWTNRSFSLETYYDKGDGRDGWKTRHAPQCPERDLSDEDRNRYFDAIQKWRATDGAQFSIDGRDREKAKDQVAYEKYLRKKYPALWERLESPSKRNTRALFDPKAYKLLGLVTRREHVGRRRAYRDGDSDGRGEFFPIWGGKDGYWDSKRLEEFSLQRVPNFPGVAESYDRYLIVFAPEDADLAEERFVSVVWREEQKQAPHFPAGLVTADGRLFAETTGGRYRGLDRVPTLEDVFKPGEEWKSIRSDLWEETDWPERTVR